MGTSSSKKRHIHDAIHLSDVPITAISSNDQTNTTIQKESRNAISFEFLTRMHQITTSINLSNSLQTAPTLYTTPMLNTHETINESCESLVEPTDYDYIDASVPETSPSLSASALAPTLVTETDMQTSKTNINANDIYTTDTNTTKGNDIVSLSYSAHKCWFVGNNSRAQFGNCHSKNILDLSLMETMPQNININQIITTNNGSAKILYNNDKFLIIPSVESNEHIRIVFKHWYYNLHGTVDGLPKNICELIVLYGNGAKITNGNIQNVFDTLNENALNVQLISGGITSNQLFILTCQNQLYAASNTATNGGQLHQINYFANNDIELQQIESTSYAAIFLGKCGRLFHCDGIGYEGEEGIRVMDNIPIQIDDIVCGSDHTLAKSCSGLVYSFGFNGCGQLGHSCKFAVYEPTLIQCLVAQNVRISMIACGAYHNVIVDMNGKVYCFGANHHFECGNGKQENVYFPELNKQLTEVVRVVNVRCGYQHSMVESECGSYYLWGDNRWNQCLVYSELEDYVCIPRKYECERDVFAHIFPGEIVDIFPGWKETRIVST